MRLTIFPPSVCAPLACFSAAGPMDLQTDEAFLEALLSFITSIPTADVRQDRPWRQQQRRLLAAQFGPREVESLAVNAIVPVAGEEENDEGESEQWGQLLLDGAGDDGWSTGLMLLLTLAPKSKLAHTQPKPPPVCRPRAPDILQARWTGWLRRRRAAWRCCTASPTCPPGTSSRAPRSAASSSTSPSPSPRASSPPRGAAGPQRWGGSRQAGVCKGIRGLAVHVQFWRPHSRQYLTSGSPSWALTSDTPASLPPCLPASLPPCLPACAPPLHLAADQRHGRLQPRPGCQRLCPGQRGQCAHQPGPLDGGQRPSQQVGAPGPGPRCASAGIGSCKLYERKQDCLGRPVGIACM